MQHYSNFFKEIFQPLRPLKQVAQENEAHLQEFRQQQPHGNHITWQNNYFKGLSGLTSKDRQFWEQTYQKQLSGITDDDTKETFFKYTAFRERFDKPDDPLKQQYFKNVRANLRAGNMEFAKNSMDELMAHDIYAERKLRENSVQPKWYQALQNGVFKENYLDDAYNGALDLFSQKTDESKYGKQVRMAQSETDKAIFDKEFDKLVNVVAPDIMYHFKVRQERGIGKNDSVLPPEMIERFKERYITARKLYGEGFAEQQLRADYQNALFGTQTDFGRIGGKGAKMTYNFVTTTIGDIGSFVSRIIPGTGGLGPNNNIARWFEDLSSTGAWSVAKQQQLKSMGTKLADYFTTSEQSNQFMNINDLWEAGAQFGFTFGSGMLAKGLNLGAKGLVRGLKAATKVKSMKNMRKLVMLEKGLTVFNAGLVGIAEAGMEADDTYDRIRSEFRKNLDIENQQILRKRVLDLTDADTKNAVQEALFKQKIAERDNSDPSTWQTNYDVSEDEIADKLLEMNPTLKEAFENEITAMVSQKEEAIDKAATNAYWNTFIINSAINGLINTTLKAGLNSTKVKQARKAIHRYLGGSSPESNIRIVRNSSNKLEAQMTELTKNKIRLQNLKERVSQAFGEGLEEYSQALTQDGSDAFANSYYTYYIDSNHNPDALKSFNGALLSAVGSGIVNAGNNLLNSDHIKEGIMGIMSTALGGVNFDSRGSREIVGWNSKRANLKIGYQGMATALHVSDKELAERNKDLAALQDSYNVLLNSGVVDKYRSLTGIQTALNNYNDALINQDEAAMRDSKADLLIKSAIMLSNTRNSLAVQDIFKILQNRANLNLNSAEVQEAIEEYKKDPTANTDNIIVNLLKESSAEYENSNISELEQLQNIKENAQAALDLIQEATKENDKIEAAFGEDYNQEAKEGLVFQHLMINKMSKRIENMQQDFNEIEDFIDQQNPNHTANVDSETARVIAAHGSLENAEKNTTIIQQKISNIEQQLQPLLNKRKALEDEVSRSKKDKNVENHKNTDAYKKLTEINYQIKQGKDVINQLEKSIKLIEKVIEKNSKIDLITDEATGEQKESRTLTTPILTAKDILNLPAQERAAILNNATKYNEDQKAEILKIQQAALQLEKDAVGKLSKDYATLTDKVEQAKQQELFMQSNPMLNATYIDTVQEENRAALIEQQYQHLFDLNTNYTNSLSDAERYNEEYDRIVNDENIDKETKDIINRRLNSDSNEAMRNNKLTHYKVNDIKRQIKGRLTDLVTKQIDANEDITDEDEEILKSLNDYLENAVDINTSLQSNSDEEIDKLFSEVFDLNKIKTYGENLGYTGEKLNKFLQAAQDINNHINKVTDAAEDIQVDDSKSNPAPQKPEHEVKAQEESKQVAEEYKNPSTNPLIIQDQKHEDDVTAKLSEDAKDFVEKALEELDEFIQNNEIIRSDLHLLLNQIANFEDRNLCLNAIKVMCNKYPINSDEFKIRHSFIVELSQRMQDNSVSYLSALNHNKQLMCAMYNVIAQYSLFASNKHETEHPDAVKMYFDDIVWVLSHSGSDHIIANYFRQYNTLDYLNSHTIDPKTEVYWMIDATLCEEVKKSMGNKYVDDKTNLPVIAVIYAEDGNLEIDGKRYQPITYLPGSERANLQGYTHFKEIRELAAQNIPESGKAFVTGTDKNTCLTSTTIEINTTATTDYGQPRSLKEAIQARFLNQNSKLKDAIDSPIVQNASNLLDAVDNILSEIQIREIPTKSGDTTQMMVIPKEKTNQKSDIFIFTAEVNNLKNRENKSLQDIIQEAQQSAEPLNILKSFNKPLQRYIDNLISILDDENLNNTEKIKKLNSILGNYIKIGGNYLYYIEYDNKTQEYKLSIRPTMGAYKDKPLIEGVYSKQHPEQLLNFIHDIFFTEKEEFRTYTYTNLNGVSTESSFAKFEVSHEDIKKYKDAKGRIKRYEQEKKENNLAFFDENTMKADRAIVSSVESLYEDNLLEIRFSLKDTASIMIDAPRLNGKPLSSLKENTQNSTIPSATDVAANNPANITESDNASVNASVSGTTTSQATDNTILSGGLDTLLDDDDLFDDADLGLAPSIDTTLTSDSNSTADQIKFTTENIVDVIKTITADEFQKLLDDPNDKRLTSQQKEAFKKLLGSNLENKLKQIQAALNKLDKRTIGQILKCM